MMKGQTKLQNGNKAEAKEQKPLGETSRSNQSTQKVKASQIGQVLYGIPEQTQTETNISQAKSLDKTTLNPKKHFLQ